MTRGWFKSVHLEKAFDGLHTGSVAPAQGQEFGSAVEPVGPRGKGQRESGAAPASPLLPGRQAHRRAAFKHGVHGEQQGGDVLPGLGPVQQELEGEGADYLAADPRELERIILEEGAG